MTIKHKKEAKKVKKPIGFVEVSPIHICIEPGRNVICDGCGDDWTDRPESGGIYGLMTKAFCPECAPEIEKSAEIHDESHFIFKRCPSDKSFADWVRDDLRGVPLEDLRKG